MAPALPQRWQSTVYCCLHLWITSETSKNTITCTSDNLGLIWVRYWWLSLFHPQSVFKNLNPPSEINLTHCDILPPQEGNMILFGCLKASVDLMGRYYTLCMLYPWYRVFQKVFLKLPKHLLQLRVTYIPFALDWNLRPIEIFVKLHDEIQSHSEKVKRYENPWGC